MKKKRNHSAREYLKKPYARVLVPSEDGTYSAEMLEFPGCFSQGSTPQEAMENLEDAAESWIEAAIEQEQEIPDPLATYGYSGKISLRIPRSVHKKAARFARKDDVSLNQFFASAIAARVGAEELYERIARRLEQRLTFAVNVLVRQVTSATYWTGLTQSGFSTDPLATTKQEQTLITADFIVPPSGVLSNG